MPSHYRAKTVCMFRVSTVCPSTQLLNCNPATSAPHWYLRLCKTGTSCLYCQCFPKWKSMGRRPGKVTRAWGPPACVSLAPLPLDFNLRILNCIGQGKACLPPDQLFFPTSFEPNSIEENKSIHNRNSNPRALGKEPLSNLVQATALHPGVDDPYRRRRGLRHLTIR